MLILISAFLLGAALGIRFKVIVLVPALMTGFLLVAAAAIVQGETVWSFASRLISIIVGLQAGYLVGTATHLWNAAVAAPTSAWLEYRQRMSF